MRHRQKPREGGDRIPADESFFRRFAASDFQYPKETCSAHLQVAVQRQASSPAVVPGVSPGATAGGLPGGVRHRGAILRAADAALIREHACRQLRPIEGINPPTKFIN